MEIEFKILDDEWGPMRNGMEGRIDIFYWRMNALSAFERNDSPERQVSVEMLERTSRRIREHDAHIQQPRRHKFVK